MAAKKSLNDEIKKLLKQVKDGDRVRLTDPDFTGLTVSVTASGASFNLRFWDKAQNKQRGPFKFATFSETVDVIEARIQARKLLVDVDNGIDIIARAAGQLQQARTSGATFNEVADLYIDYLRMPVKRQYGVCTRRESWDRVGGPEVVGALPKYQGGYLKRARAAFGTKAIASITDDDIAFLLNGIEEEGHPGLSVNLRSALFGLFKWAGAPAVDKANKTRFVRANPCSTLGPRPELAERDRVFSDAEIVEFWNALDATDCPVPRTVALALRLMLCTGMRGGEVAKLQRENIYDLDGAEPVMWSKPGNTKMRKWNCVALNSLAVPALKELVAMSDATTGPLFPAGPNGAEFKRHMLTDYLGDRGWDGFKPKDGIVRQHGLRSYLGFTEDWRPHDLRHTVATLLLNEGKGTMADVTKLLDHTPSKEDGAAKISERYGKVRAKEMGKLKRPIMNAIDTLLRSILGLPSNDKPAPAIDVAALQQQVAELQAQIEAATKVAPLRLVA